MKFGTPLIFAMLATMALAAPAPTSPVPESKLSAASLDKRQCVCSVCDDYFKKCIRVS